MLRQPFSTLFSPYCSLSIALVWLHHGWIGRLLLLAKNASKRIAKFPRRVASRWFGRRCGRYSCGRYLEELMARAKHCPRAILDDRATRFWKKGIGRRIGSQKWRREPEMGHGSIYIVHNLFSEGIQVSSSYHRTISQQPSREQRVSARNDREVDSGQR
jgi:hypothetical protein